MMGWETYEPPEESDSPLKILLLIATSTIAGIYGFFYLF